MDVPDTTDRELVRQCRKGDAAAWESIVRRHQTRIYNLVYRLTGRFDIAEDLTQEIFLKIWRNLGRYRPELGAFPTWALRLARNHVIDHHRRHAIESARTDSVDERQDRGMEFASGAATPGETLEREERREMVHRLLIRVPELYREAVVLRDLEELSYEEMVHVLGVPLGTVKSRINRGRLELARLIRDRRGIE